MDIPQSITDIKSTVESIKCEIKDVDINQHDGQFFGNENEYIYKGLLGGIDSLLTDITTLTKTPKQFLKISTHEERIVINNCLTNVNLYMQEPDSLLIYLEELKQAIRPFHIRYTETRLLEFDKELSELTSKKVKFSNQLSNLEEQLTISSDSKDKSNEILQSLVEQQENLTNSINKTRGEFDNFNNDAKHISKIKNKVDSHKEIIDNFVTKIAERETQLENQKEKTEYFNKKLEKFTEQIDGLLKIAESLIGEAKTALGYTQAQGISASYKERLNRLENIIWWKKPDLLWISAAVVFIGIGIILTILFIFKNQNTDFSTTLARLSIIALPVACAWFCAGQYTKLKNIAEDYAYKTVLAQSIIGFSEQLKDGEDDDSYKEYIKKMLDEIHQHPIPKHKKETGHEVLIAKITKVVSEQLKNDKNNG